MTKTLKLRLRFLPPQGAAKKTEVDYRRAYGPQLRELLEICFPGVVFSEGYPLDRQAFTCVGIHDGKVVATASGNFGNGMPHLAWVAVHPDYRRQNWARAICEKVIHIFEQMECPFVAVRMNPVTPAAELLYRSMGFTDEAK